MKDTKWDFDKLTRTAITILVIVGIYYLLRRLSGVLLPFIISWLIAYLMAPFVSFLQHKCKLRNRLLSVVVAIVLVLGILVCSIAALVPAIQQQAGALSSGIHTYVQHINPRYFLSPEAQERYEDFVQTLDIQTVMNDPTVQATLRKALPKIGSLIGSGLAAVTQLTVFFICLLYVIFLLLDYDNIADHWTEYVPEQYRNRVQMVMADLGHNMNSYFRGQGLIALCVGILFAIGFCIIGLPMGIAIGLIIGVLNLVPYMQALGIPPCILLALIQSAETGRPVWLCLLLVAVVFILVQATQDLFLAPRIMGNATGLTPATILLALSIWGALLGFLGLIIALPLTSVCISYYKRFILGQHDTTSNDI